MGLCYRADPRWLVAGSFWFKTRLLLVDLCPFADKHEDKLIAVVVFPTPPFWLATAIIRPIAITSFLIAVSYTHLDVYKRQVFNIEVPLSIRATSRT